MKSFALFLLLLSSYGFGQNEVNVIGIGENSQQETGIGLNSRFEAKSASGLHLSDLIEEYPSMHDKSYSQTSASGFDFISLRHQDTRYTEIWLDHVLISNPLTNFPFHLGIDLSSLGSLKIHEGPGPLSIQSSSTAGSLELFSKKKNNQSYIGLMSGNVYGNSLFGHLNLEFQNAKLSLYLRKHKAKGDYTFYSDNLTPYNTNDDSLKKRQSNSSHSDYGLLRGDYFLNQHSLSLLALSEQSANDLPAPDNKKTFAGTKRSAELARFTYTFNFPRSYLLVSNQFLKSGQSAFDPNQYIFLNSTNEKNQSITNTSDIGFFHTHENIAFNLRFSSSKSVIDTYSNQKDNHYLRKIDQIASGFQMTFENQTSLRSKVSVSQIKDALRRSNTDSSFAQDGSASWLFPIGDYSLWMTYAKQDRPPSLLESYGDLFGVSGNLDLKGEKSRLIEAGFNFDIFTSKGKICVHQIVTTDKIAFVQSNSRQVKAKNIANTKLDGLSILISEDFDRLSLSQNFYFSKTTNILSKDDLPFTPNLIGALSADFQINEGFRSGARIIGKSKFSRDEANTSTSPESLRVNFFIEFKWQKLESSFSVDNVFNELSQEIENSASGESGTTYVSDYSGYPLPGRQFKLSTLYRF
jgi:hypothetical protein